MMTRRQGLLAIYVPGWRLLAILPKPLVLSNSFSLEFAPLCNSNDVCNKWNTSRNMSLWSASTHLLICSITGNSWDSGPSNHASSTFCGGPTWHNMLRTVLAVWCIRKQMSSTTVAR